MREGTVLNLYRFDWICMHVVTQYCACDVVQGGGCDLLRDGAKKAHTFQCEAGTD